MTQPTELELMEIKVRKMEKVARDAQIMLKQAVDGWKSAQLNALRWLSVAAELGDSDARSNLELLNKD